MPNTDSITVDTHDVKYIIPMNLIQAAVLKHQRVLKEINIKLFAQKLGVDYQNYYNLEWGKYRVKITDLINISKALNIRAGLILEDMAEYIDHLNSSGITVCSEKLKTKPGNGLVYASHPIVYRMYKKFKELNAD